MKKLILAIGLLSFIGLSGCVSASKHKEQVDALQGQIDKDKVDNKNLETEVNNLQQKLITTTKDRGHLQTSLDDMKKAMDEMRERQAQQKKRLQEFKDLTSRFKSLTDAGTISVKIIDGKMVVSLGSDVLFSSGSAKLSTKGVETIKEVSKQLASIEGKRYQIEGHTDNVPISTAVFPSNWELASARALSVVRTMIDSDMPANRVSAASFGDTQPIQSNETTEGKAANRRIAIVVVPDLSSLPGYDELNKIGTEN